MPHLTEPLALISVLVTIYNVAEFLPKCLDSILAQTYTNLEIILVDDGSTDASGKICDAYAQKDPRIRVIHKPNGGVSAARNAGLDAATGEYIGFVDGDDWIAPQTYQTALERMTRHAVELVKWGHTRVLNGQVTPISSCYPSQVYRGKDKEALVCNIIKNNGINNTLWNCLFKKSVIDQYTIRTPLGLNQGEDLYFLVAYLLRVNSLFLDTALHFYNYRQNPTSLTKQYSPRYLAEIEKLLECFGALLNQLKAKDCYRAAFHFRVNKLIFYLLFVQVDFRFSKIPEKTRALKGFYDKWADLLKVCARQNKISWAKRLPVALFYKRRFTAALAVCYVLKTGFKGVHLLRRNR